MTYLNEYPTVILGSFDSGFLALPEEILVTVMRGHQKYFAVEDRKGNLSANFLAVINLPSTQRALFAQGMNGFYVRGLRTPGFSGKPTKNFARRLSAEIKGGDVRAAAGKLWRKSRAHAQAGALDYRALGELWRGSGRCSMGDRAAELAKCDLITGMVGEFPELQGVVGGLYARAQGEPEEIAEAVYDQYKPSGLDDPMPRGLTGCAVALADKLDSVVACFAVGAIPTGSSDPFALRRACVGGG